MIRSYIRPLSTLTLALALASGAALPVQVHARGVARISRAVSCPAGTTCDTALGIAFTLPVGWTRENYPAGILEFSARPTAGATYSVVRLNIASWGTTTDPDDARAATAGMDALIGSTNSAQSFVRVAVHFPGASGVLVSGLPSSPGPVTALILVHAGLAYKILAPGVTLAPDQIAALRSLCFIPRVGPFPPANGVGVPPTAPSPATSASLTATTVPLDTTFAVRAHGVGFRVGEVVTLRAAWTGVPRPGQHPRYTYYTAMRSVRANQGGALDATLTIPASPRAYMSYTVRVTATGTVRVTATGAQAEARVATPSASAGSSR